MAGLSEPVFYVAVFGYKIKIELNTFNLTIEVLETFITGEDLTETTESKSTTYIELKSPISKYNTNYDNAHNLRKNKVKITDYGFYYGLYAGVLSYRALKEMASDCEE